MHALCQTSQIEDKPQKEMSVMESLDSIVTNVGMFSLNQPQKNIQMYIPNCNVKQTWATNTVLHNTNSKKHPKTTFAALFKENKLVYKSNFINS